MISRIFLSSSFYGRAGKGITRAMEANGGWNVEVLLPEHDVRCMAAAHDGSGRVFAGTQSGLILRSEDCGQTWEPSGTAGEAVKSLAVSPHDSRVAYAGTRPAGVHRTLDAGATWQELEGFQRIPGRRFWFSPAEPPFAAYVQAISISPSDPAVILAGIEFGAVVRSEDGGHTWSGHRKGAIRDCHSLTFHPRDGAWAYEAGASWSAGAVSRDGGRTWQQPKAGLDRRYGWACAADPAQPEIWYVSASTGPGRAHSWSDARAFIFRSVAGAPWEKLAGGLPQPLDYLPYTLLPDPHAPGHLYAGLTNGDIWLTMDRGDNWEKLPVNLKGIWGRLVMIQGR